MCKEENLAKVCVTDRLWFGLRHAFHVDLHSAPVRIVNEIVRVASKEVHDAAHLFDLTFINALNVATSAFKSLLFSPPSHTLSLVPHHLHHNLESLHLSFDA